MKALRDHAVFAANINRSRSKNFPDGQVGIFPGSYLRFGSAAVHGSSTTTTPTS